MGAAPTSDVRRSMVGMRVYLCSMLISGVGLAAAVHGMLRLLAADVGESVGKVDTVLVEILAEVLTTLLAVAWLLDAWRQLHEWFAGG